MADLKKFFNSTNSQYFFVTILGQELVLGQQNKLMRRTSIWHNFYGHCKLKKGLKMHKKCFCLKISQNLQVIMDGTKFRRLPWFLMLTSTYVNRKFSLNVLTKTFQICNPFQTVIHSYFLFFNDYKFKIDPTIKLQIGSKS